jgi:protein kinase-like protein
MHFLAGHCGASGRWQDHVFSGTFSYLHSGVFSLQDSGVFSPLQDSVQDGGETFSSLPSGVFSPLQDSCKAMSPQDSNETFSSIQDSGPVDYGDFMSLREESVVEECVEAVPYYDRGLYYPICIVDVLVQRYRIEHKLGHGGFSTVWLARDIREEKDVALKIMIPGNAGEDEYNMQTEIIRALQDTSNFLTYLETFFLPGRHRDHRVLVFPVRGPNIRYCLEEMPEQLPVATRMSAARQLLKALERLHSAGIVHQGELTTACCSLNVHANYSTDLNNGNVMWDIASLDNYNTKTKYKYLGRPKKIALPSDLWSSLSQWRSPKVCSEKQSISATSAWRSKLLRPGTIS